MGYNRETLGCAVASFQVFFDRLLNGKNRSPQIIYASVFSLAKDFQTTSPDLL